MLLALHQGRLLLLRRQRRPVGREHVMTHQPLKLITVIIRLDARRDIPKQGLAVTLLVHLLLLQLAMDSY